jgi:hypothetical protein
MNCKEASANRTLVDMQSGRVEVFEKVGRMALAVDPDMIIRESEKMS